MNAGWEVGFKGVKHRFLPKRQTSGRVVSEDIGITKGCGSADESASGVADLLESLIGSLLREPWTVATVNVNHDRAVPRYRDLLPTQYA